MPNSFTNTTFSTTYKDDFKDSDHYHRILFNSGRALQARELTQLQTITQNELERLGRHIFKEGSVVLPGGLTLDRNYEFVKLETSDTSAFSVGDVIQGLTSSVQAKILEIVAATDTDPATFYVKYINSSTSTGVVDEPVRFTPGEFVQRTASSDSIRVQVVSITGNFAVGRGTRASVNNGVYFTRGHFVSVTPQSALVSKYSDTPNETIGMKVVEDVVTVSDTNALYDNQNNNIPNLTAPGADRYRITLTLAMESELDSGDNFFSINEVANGLLLREVDDTEYARIDGELSARTKEESGDYIVEGFTSVMEAGDSDRVLSLNVEGGIAYVDGRRVARPNVEPIVVNKPRETEVVEETVSANFGNYVRVTAPTLSGIIPNINVFQTVTLKNAVNFGGSEIGTARVRSLVKDGANYRLHLFDIKINDGSKFSEARSIGLTTGHFNLVTEGGVAVIKEAVNNNLFFGLGKIRPSLVDDVTLTVQRRFTATTNGSGVVTLSGLGTDESFSNSTSWIVALDSASATQILPDATATNAGEVTTGRPAAETIEVLALVDKTASAVTIRPKTRTVSNQIGLTVDSDGTGVKFIRLDNPDIFKLNSAVDSATSVSVLNRFSLDNGQRDNFYLNGRLILKSGFSAPAGPITVNYEYFEHGAGDFFAVNSYDANDIGYQNIPKHILSNGLEVDLRNFLDFRPYRDSADGSFTASDINELPINTDTIAADITYYKGRNDILVLTPDQEVKYIEGVQALDNRLTPETPALNLKIKEFQLQPFTDDLEDVDETFIENRRFTMRDISAIVERIDNIEEAVSLNLLEASTASLEVLDSDGNPRFRNGFFADNFANLFYSDVENEQYTASFNLHDQLLQPDFVENEVPLVYDSADTATSNTKLTGNALTLDYTSSVYINQNLASETENINPFEVITFTGELKLSPEVDEWEERRFITRTIRRIRTF